MTNLPNIMAKLSPDYFWDVDISKVEPNISKRLIIERVFSLGSVEDMRLVMKWYGENEVIKVLQNLNYLDKKTLNFISKLFKLPLITFKCYRRRQSIHQPWN